MGCSKFNSEMHTYLMARNYKALKFSRMEIILIMKIPNNARHFHLQGNP